VGHYAHSNHYCQRLIKLRERLASIKAFGRFHKGLGDCLEEAGDLRIKQLQAKVADLERVIAEKDNVFEQMRDVAWNNNFDHEDARSRLMHGCDDGLKLTPDSPDCEAVNSLIEGGGKQ
jgi:hypothetical protein